MNKPILSICIPTYNRASELEICLESIKDNLIDNVEIVVSDNASNDHTIDVLNNFSNILPLRWQQQSVNVGSDRNFIDVVDFAKGDYCWILGSDDCITPESLKFIVNKITKYKPDIFHFSYIQGDKYLRPLSRIQLPNSVVPFSMNQDNAIKYIANLKNLSLVFMFISCFIFSRNKWQSHKNKKNKWIGTNYIHAFIVHSMIACGATLLSSDKCIVIARSGENEWTLQPGRLLFMDATTLVRIYLEVNNDRDYLYALSKVFRRSYRLYVIFVISIYGGFQNIYACKAELVKLGYSIKLIYFLYILYIFNIFLIIFKLIKFRRFIINFFVNLRLINFK